ncbi:MAG: response regulator [Candidatus Poribacteria bacterium]|nr:response regulator [Candidatus Poribacteria bacterium]
MVRHSDRILLVDDDTSSLEVLHEVLTRAGYDVVSAESGHEALEFVRGDSINLAILDFNLPDTTGSELLQQIKQFHPAVPVIIMSANTSQSVKFDVFEAGAYTFISKPIALPQLLQFVTRALDLTHQWTSSHRDRRQAVRPAADTSPIQIKKSIFFRWIQIIKHK